MTRANAPASKKPKAPAIRSTAQPKGSERFKGSLDRGFAAGFVSAADIAKGANKSEPAIDPLDFEAAPPQDIQDFLAALLEEELRGQLVESLAHPAAFREFLSMPQGKHAKAMELFASHPRPGSLDALKSLIAHGIDPNLPVTAKGSTALMLAIHWGSAAEIDFLLPLSDTAIVNEKGATALSTACGTWSFDAALVRRLLAREKAAMAASENNLRPATPPFFAWAKNDQTKIQDSDLSLAKELMARSDLFFTAADSDGTALDALLLRRAPPAISQMAARAMLAQSDFRTKMAAETRARAFCHRLLRTEDASGSLFLKQEAAIVDGLCSLGLGLVSGQRAAHCAELAASRGLSMPCALSQSEKMHIEQVMRRAKSDRFWPELPQKGTTGLDGDSGLPTPPVSAKRRL